MGAPARTWPTVLALGTTQTLAWASSYYLPALLAAPIARGFGVSEPTVFAAFSVVLVLAALVGPAVGRFIDHQGGRGLLMATNVAFAAGLALLGAAPNAWVAALAAALIGLAMGAGLYDAAFATLVRLYGRASRDPITGITLLAGFASTIGWPLSAWMSEAFGWRGACYGWAMLHLVLGLPLNALLPRASAATAPVARGMEEPAGGGSVAVPAADLTAAPPVLPARGAAEARLMWRNMLLLAFVFSAGRFITTGISTHLPGLLMAIGATLAAAVTAGALVGPAQVAGRLIEFGLLRRVHPLGSARLASLGPLLGMGALLAFGLPAAMAFALLHGAGNGILTIAKGTLPLALFGAQGYGVRQGWMTLPSLALQALAPWAYGLVLADSVQAALAMSCAISASAVVALLLLRRPPGG